jgi:predicted nucleotidyltransferase
LSRRPLDRREGRLIVARQAAMLLYEGTVYEYKEAKEVAAENLGINVMPSNYEVAMELRKYAEEVEGATFAERLKSMREDALEVMKALSEFAPRLVGSVWRGVLTPRSDIDIEVYTEDLNAVLSKLEGVVSKVLGWEEINLPEQMRLGSLYRIRAKSKRGYELEIVLKEPGMLKKPVRCEIFGDLKKGLSINELEELLMKDPEGLRVPKGRVRVG